MSEMPTCHRSRPMCRKIQDLEPGDWIHVSHPSALSSRAILFLASLRKSALCKSCGNIDLLDVNSAARDAPAPGVAQAPLHGKLFRIAIGAHRLKRFATDIANHFVCKAL